MNRSPVALVRNSPTRCPMGSTLLCANEINKCSMAVNIHSTPATNYADNNNKNKKAEVAFKLIKESDIVCFDVDSTVIEEEGIDELADFCGKGSEVARVTREAMGGSMTFQDALTLRLNIINPSQTQVNDFLKQRPSSITKGVKEFVKYLKSEGKQVFLISGGFDSLIEPVATELNIPMKNVFANRLCFKENGEYEKFDTAQPTSRSGGKSKAVSIIKEMCPSSVITMIGDGITDLEAVPPANFFIGFGGNVVRSEVFQKAMYYVTDFDQLWKTK